MADEATWVTTDTGTKVTIGMHRWIGDLRPDLMSVYGFSDQDGSIGGKAYLVDFKPRMLEVVVWGAGDTIQGGGEDGEGLGVVAQLKATKNRVGTLTFFDGFVVENVRLLNVRYIRPIGVGRDTGTEVFSEIETVWMVEG